MFRKHFNATTALAVAALVFAMAGGAYAAGKYLITSTKQIKPSVLKQLHGAAGPQGSAGPGGPQGPVGPEGKAGANGKDGANGVNGKDGTNGSNGTGVTVGATAVGCKAGGVTVEAEGSKAPREVCNGENGQSGFTESLPSGKTETGVWTMPATAPVSVCVPDVGHGEWTEKECKTEAKPSGSGDFERASGGEANPQDYASISFAIPLKQDKRCEVEPGVFKEDGLCPAEVHYVGTEEVAGKTAPAACPGTVSAPKATAGNLCVYEGFSFGVETRPSSSTAFMNIFPPNELPPGVAGAPGASTSGAVLLGGAQGEASAAYGSWAVTAP